MWDPLSHTVLFLRLFWCLFYYKLKISKKLVMDKILNFWGGGKSLYCSTLLMGRRELCYCFLSVLLHLSYLPQHSIYFKMFYWL